MEVREICWDGRSFGIANAEEKGKSKENSVCRGRESWSFGAGKRRLAEG